jgi:hypothetical protein
MTVAPDAPGAKDPRQAHIEAVRQALGAHGMAAQVVASEPVCHISGPRTAAIRCEHRGDDGGTLWLYDEATSDPIAPADAEHLHELITWAKGKTAVRM